MYFSVIVIPFYLLTLAVLIAGEVRAYRSHQHIGRVVGLPLAFVLIPVFANTGTLFFSGVPQLLLRDFFTLVWPLAALVWGTLQILRERNGTDTPINTGEPPAGRSGAAPVKPARHRAVSPGVKVTSVILFAGGLLGVLGCLVFLVFMIIYSIGYGGAKASDVLLWSAAFVNYCFYPWVVWRRWPAGWLLAGGILVHLHVLHWVNLLNQTPDAVPAASVFLIGLLTYSLYTWLVWRVQRESL